MRWYKLEGKIPIPVDIIKHPEELDMMQDGKRLHLTTLPCGGMVSTVFLNLDHSFGGDVPVLFETMLFVSEDDYTDLDMTRYHTWDEAVDGHWQMVIKHGGVKPMTKEDCTIQLDEGLFEL